jgi:TolB-like protein/DNA-binding winged helix-turn-helix (wHTH) protein
VHETPPSHALIRFGVFELDTESGELRKQGVKVRLQEQPFQILQILLEHPGRIVTREDLKRRIWPSDTFVDFDTGLYNAIKRLREALGDSAESPRFIETLSRRGYRFVAAVEGNGHAATTPALPLEGTKPGSRRNLRLGIVVGMGVAIVVGAALGVGRFWRHSSSSGTDPQIRSIAVLPLQNLSDDPAQEYFSDGMTDSLITDLAQIGSLKVISRTSSMQYKQTKKSLPDIARELNVDGIVEGTVQRSGDRVRITAQLILAPADKHLWANSYERDLRDIFLLERDVAGDIAGQVRARLATDNQAQLVHQRAVNPSALEAYLQGISHMHKFSRGFGDEELALASECFRRAIDAQPDFAAAYVGMAEARHDTLRSSDEDIDTARKAAERAVELDPNLSDAWTELADIKRDFWDWPGAEQGYRRALALNPNDAVAHDGLGSLLDAQGRMDEGLKEAEIAQQLDPNNDHLEPALENRHEYDEVIQHITTMLEADPDNGILHHKLYEGYAGKEMYKEAIQQLEQAAVLFGFRDTAFKLRQAFPASGYRGAMRKWAEELEHLQATNQVFAPINVAVAYAAAGDKERAFYWLEQACKRRGHGYGGIPMVFLNRDPGLDPLRSDPRFKDLLRRVGLPQ